MTGTAWSRAANLLCVRLDSLGDVLMTTPAIRALRESRPGRRVTLLTSPAGAAVARLVPEIDDVLVYEAPWMKATAPQADSRPEYAMADRLRAGGFDAAVIFTVYSQNPLPSAMLCHLADIPLRLAHCHENPYQLLSDWVKDPEPADGIRHEVRRHLDLVATVGSWTADERLSLRVRPEVRAAVQDRLRALGIDGAGPWAVIHPGASAPSRRYPPEGFAEAARRLVIEDGWAVVFTGDAGERGLVDEIRARMDAPSHALVGALDLEELAALIGLAPVVISNNTGPAHIAAALGTPVVDLYALTNPQHTPWAVPSRVLFHDVPCKWCYKSICPLGHQDCLRLVPPDAVVRAARDLLHEVRAGAQGTNGAARTPPLTMLR
ncbi:MAG: lipopolysaccharide heptosyltransferase II [Chloroflexota bacterium]|nr:lipopolysaccharide heptosyltransferase II [Chloroflexota bacterium]